MIKFPVWVLIAFAVPLAEPIASPVADLRFDMREALEQVRPDDSGEVYEHGPYFFKPEHLGVAVALVDGTLIEVGDTTVGVPFMSVSKPFSYAAAIEHKGAAFMAERVGLNATGLPFNAPVTPEVNPLVNVGAIAVHSYLDGFDTLGFFSKLAGERLTIPEEWRVEPMPVTMATAWFMASEDVLVGDPKVAAQKYLEACIVEVTPVQLARMGAVLASGGVRGEERLMRPQTVRQVLSVTATAGMYEDSGEWFSDVGMPAKSGVSGTVLAVAPGWGAIAAYSPLLDEAGNSVRGSKVIELLAEKWRLHFVDRGFH
jgi:glutaminase